MDKKFFYGDKCSSEYFPENTRCFSQINILRKETLENKLPNIRQIISSVIDFEVLSIRLVETIEGMSNDRECSSGKKTLVDLKFREKIMYISDAIGNSVHIMEGHFYHTETVMVPGKIHDLEIDKLITKGLLAAKIENECSIIKTQDKRTIVMHLFFFLELYERKNKI